MKLRNTTFIYLAVLILTIIGLQIFVTNYRLRNNYDNLERDFVMADARRASKALHRELISLDTTAWDWASWDDAYKFAEDGNKEFIASNMPIETFTTQALQLIAFFKEDGTLLFGKAIDENGKENNLLLLQLLRTLKNTPLPTIDDSLGRGGLILLPQGPIIISQRPILTSNDQGPAKGYVLMTRALDAKFRRNLATQLELPLQMRPLQRGVTKQAAIVPIRSNTVDITANQIDAYTIAGHAILNNMNGEPAFLLSMTAKRHISIQGRHEAAQDSLFLAAVIAVFSLLIFFLLQRKVLSRLEKLNNEVRQLDLTNVTAAKITSDGQDEISELGHSVNALIHRIVEDQAALREAHEGLEEKVAQRTAELKMAMDELRVLDKAKTQFLSSTSHELRTPLTAIRGFVKLMRRTFETKLMPEISENVKPHVVSRHLENYLIVQAESERLRKLVDDLLDLNKIVAGALEWNNEEIAANELVRTAEAYAITLFAEDPEVELLVESEANECILLVDPVRIRQVLEVLLSNAAKFTEEGHVKLSVHPHGPSAVIFAVEDTSGGIADEDLGHILEIFYRIQSGGELSGATFGTGLTLPLCKRIIEHYHGELNVQTELGVGTQFSFILPLK